MKYEKPYLEEIDLQLEGSFLADATKPDPDDPNKPGVDIGGEGKPDIPWD